MTPRYPVMSAQHTVIPAKAGIHPSRRGASCGRPSLRPLPLWGRLREGARRQARGRPEGASSGFPTQRRPLRNPPPSVIPAKAGIHPSLRPLPLWRRLERGRAPSGLFSPRRPLQTPSRGRPTPAGLGKGRRRGVLPPLPLGEGWGEGGGRRGPRDLVEARPPSYAKVSPREKIEMRGPLATTKAHRSAPLSPSECPAPPPSVIPAKVGIHPSLRPPHPTATLAQPAPIRHSRESGNPSLEADRM